MALTECVECGGKVSTRAEVCIHCGSPVEPPTPQINCPDCGEGFASSLTTCPACGGPAEEEPTQAEEVEILESVAVEEEPAPIIQETVSAPSTEPESSDTKDEPFNTLVALAVGAFVFQIARSLGLDFGPLTVVFLLVPCALLVRYGKKQSPQVYAGIIGALVVVMGIAIAAGPGDVFVPQSAETTSDVRVPQASVRENTSMPQVETRPVNPTPSASCADFYWGGPSLRGRAPLEVLRPCAEQGYVDAQYWLGRMYANGENGVPEDDVEAVRWYRLAAEKGYRELGGVNAQYSLGLMYQFGTGVSQDYVLASMWYNLAVAQGSENAQETQDILEQRMTPEQIAEAQRLSREWIAANPPPDN